MWDLRWVLAGLGALLVVGVYLASKGLFRRRTDREAAAWDGRQEPIIDDQADARSESPSGAEEQVAADLEPGAVEGAAPGTAPGPRKGGPRAPAESSKPAQKAVERVIALRLVPKTGNDLPADGAVLALRALGLQHGRYGIFHWLDERGQACFSVASLTEPGSFDLTKLTDSAIAGLSVFMVLPGPGDPVERFDTMIATARDLAQRLECDLLDERGSSWSIQRERYIREEIIEYRYQLEHA